MLQIKWLIANWWDPKLAILDFWGPYQKWHFMIKYETEDLVHFIRFVKDS